MHWISGLWRGRRRIYQWPTQTSRIRYQSTTITNRKCHLLLRSRCCIYSSGRMRLPKGLAWYDSILRHFLVFPLKFHHLLWEMFLFGRPWSSRWGWRQWATKPRCRRTGLILIWKSRPPWRTTRRPARHCSGSQDSSHRAGHRCLSRSSSQRR